MSEKPAAEEDLSDQMLKELQSWWEIPSIAQYISLFREAFNLPEIEIEELENSLIDDTIKGPNKWLQNLLYSFLRSILPGRVKTETWETELQKLVKRKWQVPEKNPFLQNCSFSQLSLRSKVEIIHELCYYRLDRNDIEQAMKSMDAEALRVKKLGVDDLGNSYWYFYGTRLYKEESIKETKSWDEEWQQQKQKFFKKRGRGRPRKKQLKSDGESDDFEDMDKKDKRYMNANAESCWSVVCNTMEEWVNFAEKFKNTKSKNEKALFQVIQENFLPVLSQIYEEKERKLQQKLRELLPIREKIITRRETRKLRGEVFESPDTNEYNVDPYVQKKDRAQRLEERNKRLSEGILELEKENKRRHRRILYSEGIDPFTNSILPSINQQENENRNEQDIESKRAHRRIRYSDGIYPFTNSILPQQENENRKEQEIESERALLPKTDMGNSKDLQSEMEKLMSSVKLHKDAWPFLYPVKEEQAPGYYEIIKEPMDLSKIEKRLYSGCYDTLGQLDADFSQMVSNCELYNGEHHAYTKMVHTLWKMYRKRVSEILKSLPHDKSLVVDFGESSDSSNQGSKASHLQVCDSSSEISQKSKRGRKRKSGMEALEILAQASELAIQSSNTNDLYNGPNALEEQNKSNGFSNLKILPIHSHPPALIEKYSSESSSDDTGENDSSSNNSSPYVNQEDCFNGHYMESSPNETIIPATNESVSYVNNSLSQLSNFIEKNNTKSLNVLSTNDVSNILSDASSSHHENSSSSSLASESGSFPKGGSPDNLDQGLENILDECNDNVSNFISSLMKQPSYNSDNQLITRNKVCNTEAYIENMPKQSSNMCKNVRSPLTSNFTGHPVSENIMPDHVNSELSAGSPSNISTIDASAVGITSYADTFSKKPRYSDMSDGSTSHNNCISDEIRNPSGEHAETITKPNRSYRSKQRKSPNNMIQEQYYETSNVLNNSQVMNVSDISNQPVHMDISNSACNAQATFVSPAVTNIGPQIPLQIPGLYSKIMQPQVKNQMQHQNNSLMRVDVQHPSNQLVFVSEANKVSGGQGVTYHVYTQSKRDSVMVEGHVNFLENETSRTKQISPGLQHQTINNQEKIINRATPPKKSPVPQHVQATSFHVPSKNLTPVSNSSSPKASVSVTSANFSPVNSFMPIAGKDKLAVKRMKVLSVNQAAISQENTNLQTSSSVNSNVNSLSHNGHLYQTVPLVLSGYNQSSSDVRLKNNPGAPIAVQPNLCIPNSIPVVQQVLIPSGPQQFPIQNGGQFVFTTPQNSINNLFNKEQSIQLSNKMNQGLGKVVPQIVAPPSIMQITKDNLIQGFQFQPVPQNSVQAYAQVTQNPQFVSIPAYMITNQNPLQDPSTQTVMNVQSYQLPQRQQTQINGQGNR